MLDIVLAVLIPCGVLGLSGLGYWVWVRYGTGDPVDHHSSMPERPDWPDG
ncbi:hypothetical protein ACWGB8_31765 [Kitasatospora sp. NPDC054939]